MGAASAADDISIDAVDASVDDVLTVDAGDSTIVDETPVDAVSDDAAAEEVDDGIQTDEISDDLTTFPSSPNLLKNLLGSSVLGDWDTHDVIYVNGSSSNDPYDGPDEIDGHDWEHAYGGDWPLEQALANINNDGTIYIAEGTYNWFGDEGAHVNCTLIGMDRLNTIFDEENFHGAT